MKERLDAMIRDYPWLLDADVCTDNDEFGTWSGTDPQEDVNVIEYVPEGGRFLGIGMRPHPADPEYRVIWPEDDHGSD